MTKPAGVLVDEDSRAYALDGAREIIASERRELAECFRSGHLVETDGVVTSNGR